MAGQELTTEQALQLLQGRSAAPQVATPIEMPLESVATPSNSLLSVDTPYKRALGVGAGGLLNLADALTFGMTGNLAAGGSAIYGDIESLFTGQPSTTSFELERQKLAELKNLARAEQVAQGFAIPESVPLIGGAPIVEVAGALKAPIPKAAIIGKGEKLIRGLARAVPVATVMGALPAASVEVPAEDIASLATLGGGIGGGVAGLLPIIGAGARQTALTAGKLGKEAQRFALGTRKSDYTKAGQNAIIRQSAETPAISQLEGLELERIAEGVNLEGNVKTQVQTSLDNIIENKTLGTSLEPTVMYDKLMSAMKSVEGKIQNVLRKVDNSDQKITMPSFVNAKKYIDESRVDITQTKAYENIIDEFVTAVKNESKFVEPTLPTLYDEFGKAIPKEEMSGMRQALEKWTQKNKGQSKLSLDVLNKQRKVIGQRYKDSVESDPGFWRAFYKDLKEHIEKYAPEVKDLNKQKQDLVVVEPIIGRSVREAPSRSFISEAMRQLYTTGGAGLVGGATLGGLFGQPEAGAAGAMGLRLLATPKGQQLAGRGLSRLSQALADVGGEGGLITGIPSTVLRSSALTPALSEYGLPQEQMMTPLQQVSAPSSRELSTEEALSLIKER
jgi:hypothetical protein